LEALPAATSVFVADLDEALLPALAGIVHQPLGTIAALPDGAAIAALDPEAYRLARMLPRAATVPGRERLRERAIGAQVARLVQVGGHLRRECPWDREQTIPSIVP